ncbi:related to Beta3 protein (Ruby) [Sporisorium reilianum f. sp. reilianum]|uniref:Related to Beta3 protein (Ruby) n=1 Tax=Sporisorium reilianum f. sp. reilianum TaxID=72559 RepID=A0A2N8UEY4_9BASI|nr:related to Beta3 protein (Ruby) [Sporisorium reilianum f. sp. reilianum]
MSAAYSNSSRALAFLSETSEDAIAALKGLVGGVGSAKYLDTSEDKLSTIATQIDSSRDEDRIAALTRIVAMVSKGRDASSFLPAVLKLTSSSNLDVRKLVYIVLLRYANTNPDLTLLSINSFQRDLSDPSPLIRAMALRVLSSIKVAMVAPIVIMAVAKASRDPNLYVRKIAALAIPKCYQIDRSQLDTLQGVLATLLSDRSPFVLGAALSSFQRMCPANWSLLHQNYRKICHALSDMDEWGQVVALQVLSRYARANLVQPKSRNGSSLGPDASAPSSQTPSAARTPEIAPKSEPENGKKNQVDGLEAFLASDAPSSVATVKAAPSGKAASLAAPTSSSSSDLDRDLELLLSKSHGLLHSRNPAVVLAGARAILYLAPASDHVMLVRPLVRLLRSTPDVSYLVLLNILAIARQNGSLFAPHVTSFLLGASHEEPIFLSLLKLDTLVVICNLGNLDLVLTEVASHLRSADAAIAAHAVSCLGELALRKDLDASSRCLAILLDLLRKRKTGPCVHDSTIARAVLAIKNLLQLAQETGAAQGAIEPRRTSAIVYRLAALLFGTPSKNASSTGATAEKQKRRPKAKVIGKGAILHPEARASILWLLGQHARQSITVSDKTSASLPPKASAQETKTLAELVVPDILRQCALNFTNESSIVKLQIPTMSSKAFAFLPTVLVPTPALDEGQQGKSERLMATVTVLHFYLLKLARYDADFDVRDRARFLKGLTAPLTAQKKSLQVGDEAEGEGPSSVDDTLTRGDTIQAAIEKAARTVGETTTEDGDADLKGVRLRREQVIHVLFEGKAAFSSTTTNDDDANAQGQAGKDTDCKAPARADGPEIASLSLVLGGKLIKGWLDTTLPEWTTQPTPSTTREPPAVSAPTHPTLQNTTLANLKSFSSSDFAAPTSSPVVLTPGKGNATPTSRGSSTPIELEANTTSTQTLQKYKDLDSFLDESDDDEHEVAGGAYLDDSAPEDDDFRANDWDGEEDDDEEEEEDDNDEDDDEETSSEEEASD